MIDVTAFIPDGHLNKLGAKVEQPVMAGEFNGKLVATEPNVFKDALRRFLDSYADYNSQFLETLKSVDKIVLPPRLLEEIAKVTQDLGFDESVKSITNELLTQLYVRNTEKPIHVSKSSDNELLIYLQDDQTYKNVLIDDDGDIELLVIPADKSKTYNKLYFRSNGFNYSSIVNTFDGMR